MSDLIERLRARDPLIDELIASATEARNWLGVSPTALRVDHAIEAVRASQAAAVEDYNNALAEIERLKGALKAARDAYTVEYGDDGSVLAVGHGSMMPMVLALDAALRSSNA